MKDVCLCLLLTRRPHSWRACCRCVNGTFRSKALGEGLALLLTRVGGSATLVTTKGTNHYYSLEESRPSAVTIVLRDVFLDPVASIEVVESSRSHVYDLTVAKTRNMVTESGLVQRDVPLGGPGDRQRDPGRAPVQGVYGRDPKHPNALLPREVRHPKLLRSVTALLQARCASTYFRDLVVDGGFEVVEDPAEHGGELALAARLALAWERLKGPDAEVPPPAPCIVFRLSNPARLAELTVVLTNKIGSKLEVVPLFPTGCASSGSSGCRRPGRAHGGGHQHDRPFLAAASGWREHPHL